jgi:tellurite resistance protein TerC
VNVSGTPALWIAFAALIVALLALDLGLFRRSTSTEMSLREALVRSTCWIALAAAFNAGVYHMLGTKKGLEFTTSYLLEQALSVDNLFVFVLIFSAFKVKQAYQHRVLFWGIVGAVVLRGVFIGLGSALIQRFAWVTYIFGAILIWTAWKLLRGGDEDEEFDPDNNLAFRWFTRIVPSVPDFRETHFLVREGGKWMATPLLAVLVLVETSDVLFALDSIPAVFGVTSDPFIVYTSNIFAILGLRSLYFLLAKVVQHFVYLKTGLAIILSFVGLKMMIHEFYVVPTLLSLGIIFLVLVATVLASMIWPKREVPEHKNEHAETGGHG